MTVQIPGHEVIGPPVEYGQGSRREHIGWYSWELANSAFSTTVVVVFLHPYRTAVAHGSVLTDAFRQLWHTLRGVRAYPLTHFLLAAYLLYNAGIQTVMLKLLPFGLAYLTESYGTAVISLIAFFLVGFLTLSTVPLRRAIVAAGNTSPRVR